MRLLLRCEQSTGRNAPFETEPNCTISRIAARFVRSKFPWADKHR